MGLSGVDLNLLIALDALLSERNVTRAAERTSVGQPAMSTSLARLRKHFDDQLLVRTGLTMILNAQPGIEVVGEATDGHEAVAGTQRQHLPAADRTLDVGEHV